MVEKASEASPFWYWRVDEYHSANEFGRSLYQTMGGITWYNNGIFKDFGVINQNPHFPFSVPGMLRNGEIGTHITCKASSGFG